jgi:tubulin polyglutamylase TTLL4
MYISFAVLFLSLHSNSQLDRNIKGQMIKDLLNLAAFRIPENLVTTTTAR